MQSSAPQPAFSPSQRKPPQTRLSAEGVSVVLIAYQTGDELILAAESATSQANALGRQPELILIDNSPDDRSCRALRRWASGQSHAIKLVTRHNRRNLGFGRAVNQGLQLATNDLVLLLNPDAELLDGALAILVEKLTKTPEAGLIAPRLVLPSGDLQESPRRFYNLATALARRTPFRHTRRGKQAQDRHLYSDTVSLLQGSSSTSPPSHLFGGSVQAVDWVSGAVMLLRRSALPSRVPFDGRYFLYFEDVDLCRQLRAAGKLVLFAPDACARHSFGAASRHQVPWNPLLWQHALSGLLYADRWSAPWWKARPLRRLATHATRGLMTAMLLVVTTVIFLPLVSAATFVPILLLLLPRERTGIAGRAPLPSLLHLSGVLLGLGLLAALLKEGTLTWGGVEQLILWTLSTTLLLRLASHLARTGARVLRGLGIGHRPCLVVGHGKEAEDFLRALSEQTDEGLHVAGTVRLGTDDRPSLTNTPPLGEWTSIREIVERLRAHKVLVCCPPERLALVAEGLPALRASGVDVSYVLQDSVELLQHEQTAELAGYPLLQLGRSGGGLLGARAWEGGERLLAMLGLGLLAPFTPLLAALSVLASGRPPLTRVPRAGLGGNTFSMFRLRTGAGDSDEVGGGILGRFLRWAHLDELPQLLNVLRGEMSFVGPRPVRPEVAMALPPGQRARFQVRPGITGIWQLDRMRRWRLEQMLNSDLLYVLRRSPSLDLRILAQTLFGRRNP